LLAGISLSLYNDLYDTPKGVTFCCKIFKYPCYYFSFMGSLSVLDWIDRAQERYRWRALVNAVMNLPLP
jgi:hypothetical protein